MKLGIFAKTFSGSDPRIVLLAARNAGYAAVQYNWACSGLAALPQHIPTEHVEAVRLAGRQCGVEISAVSATYNMAHPDASVRQSGLAALRAIAAAAPAMGTRLLTLCTGSRDAANQWRFHPENSSPEAWSVMRASMIAALEIAERHNVDLGIEPELANIVSTPALAQRLIDELKSPRLRIVLDAANLFEAAPLAEQREIVSRGIELLADRISIAHAKDRCAGARFTSAGNGVLDYPHYLECLRRSGFTGPLITHGLAESEAPRVAGFLSGLLSESSAR
ncbi:MAG: sugar phosphate isomerase/epimerase [Acidobacteria bacterium]|nr:sugar phosphate isomerase/epimerase [Acidobacteriota bacterium]